jgi:predicted hydrocarbon binding protein
MVDERETAEGFRWGDLGDIAAGRPNLGPQTSVAVYRMLQFSLRAAIRAAYGPDAPGRVLSAAGRLAGREFCRNVLDRTLPPGPFLAGLQKHLREWGIGLLRIERVDFERLEFTVAVAEDLDCSGLPVSGETVCEFDEGFLAGVLGEYTGRAFTAREVDCWASGERVCRFRVQPAPEPADG